MPSDQIVSEEIMALLSLLKMTAKNRGRNDITKCEGLLTSVLYLHDPTCQDIDGERITMDTYLGKITKSYIENYKNSEIAYEFICDRGLVFDRTLAQACGTAAVELISNSLYHAFGQGKVGKITISMIRDQTEGNYLLSVVDTGPGIPQIDETKESGISMVRDIARSLRGTVEVASTTKGAHVTMAFPIPVLI
jgi:two-component sensor histidine kinase